MHLNTLENLDAEQNLGHAFYVMRTDLFQSTEDFARRMDEILDFLKSTTPAAGVERVLVPGEIESANEKRLRSEGVPLPREVCASLRALAEETHVHFPDPVSV